MAIKFDVEKLIGKLDIIQKTQIPFAAKQALKQYGFLVSKKLLPAEMNKSFDAPSGVGQPVQFTLNAIRYNVDGMTLKIFVPDNSEGGKRKEYLYPAFYGGKPKPTKLQASIFKASGMFGVPAYGNLRSLGKLTQYADIKRSYASQIAGALSGKNKQIDGGRLLVVKGSRRGLKPNAIYRVKGSSVIRLFTLINNPPTLPVALPYENFVKRTAEQRLPSLLSLQLQRAMASR
ncbi:MAG: hypothetical protein CMA71_06315 [Euryarchaeota archaeon]|jgi:hypothetical protein|nr:hypothetical protein [Euryarchaeota archaeon]|tara:strand:+ start:343 stop:1038 length:696 start_codon:yes stop_codon:yes gene_type:complete